MTGYERIMKLYIRTLSVLYITKMIHCLCTSRLTTLQLRVAHTRNVRPVVFGYAPQVFEFYTAHVNLGQTKIYISYINESSTVLNVDATHAHT